jgi:membrane-bound serine protease (ClpP class)
MVLLLEMDGTVNAALADFITQGLDRAETENAAAVLIRMDTPGGMVSITKKIIKSMENSPTPVIVYVAPSGSSASSAGALITMAADVAAMAPGTNIGAAHPVGGGGETIQSDIADKVMNDLTAYMRSIVLKKGRNAEWVEKAIRQSVSVTAAEALELKVVDLVATDVTQLLNAIDGREIKRDDKSITLRTKGAKIERIPMGLRFQILDVIAHPNVAYVLMMIGMLGIMVEVTHPGAIFPGVAGGICLLLAFFASQALPTNYVGVLLIILSIILFVAELKVTSYGALAIGAVISFVLGSIMIFDTGEKAMRVSWGIIIPTAFMVTVFFVGALGLAVKAWMKPSRTGAQGLVGIVGVAVTDLDSEGTVAVHGEFWNARADRRIAKGDKVRVLRVEDLHLTVTREPV